MKFPLEEVTHTDNIKLSDDGRSVVIIDQTLLPNRLEYIALTTREEMFEAIAMLRVRGAPAIGICAGYCAYCLALPGPPRFLRRFLRPLGGGLPLSQRLPPYGGKPQLGAEPHAGRR